MNWSRVFYTLGMCFCLSGQKRAQYIKKHNIFSHIGDHCMVMFRKIPLYPKLISLGENVWIASGVTLITHDAIHHMLNNKYSVLHFEEYAGCIDIKDNVFIGSNTTVLPNVTIGPDTIVAAGSLINKSLPSGVYGGVPARYIESFDEFVKKRLETVNEEIKQNRGQLSAETINNLWAIKNCEGKNNGK